MRDTVLVETVDPDAEPVLDPETNEVVTPYKTVFEGACRLVPTDFKDLSETAGETAFDVADANLALPITVESGAIRNGDRATITAVDAVTGDPANVGRVFTVQRDPARTYPIERRFSCQEVS